MRPIARGDLPPQLPRVTRVARITRTARIGTRAVLHLATRARIGLAASALIAASGTHLAAQSVLKPMTATAVVPAVAKVVSTSPLVSGKRMPTGDLYISGTVVSTNNGAFALQARLSTAIADTVMGQQPDGTLAMLTVPGWVTVATGSGGPNKTSAVTFLVKWGKGSKKRPADAEAVPITYRVLTQN